jgi:hypothetical protein
MPLFCWAVGSIDRNAQHPVRLWFCDSPAGWLGVAVLPTAPGSCQPPGAGQEAGHRLVAVFRQVEGADEAAAIIEHRAAGAAMEGVMLGRAAWRRPWDVLADADRHVFGAATNAAVSRRQVRRFSLDLDVSGKISEQRRRRPSRIGTYGPLLGRSQRAQHGARGAV